jgi:hypothetical protein
MGGGVAQLVVRMLKAQSVRVVESRHLPSNRPI